MKGMQIYAIMLISNQIVFSDTNVSAAFFGVFREWRTDLDSTRCCSIYWKRNLNTLPRHV